MTAIGAEGTAIARSRRLAPLLVAAVLVLLAFGASKASAGSIAVWACHQPSGEPAPLDGWDWQVSGLSVSPWSNCSAGWAGWFGLDAAEVARSGAASGQWRFTAPAGTSVTQLRYHRGVGVFGSSDYSTIKGLVPLWDTHLLEYCQPALGCAGLTAQEVAISNLGGVAGLLLYLRGCTLAGGCPSSSHGWLAVSTATVTLQDNQAPTFSALTGTLSANASLRGDATLDVQLADVGTGVYKIHATVDGRSFDDRVLDANGGKCRAASSGRDFLYAVPCRLGMGARTTLPTASLADGTHDVQVDVEDAAGNTTTIFHANVTSHNAPVVVAAPEISGTPMVTSPLTAAPGTWSPAPTSYTYQWLRCPSSGEMTSCDPIAGATAATYAPIAEDAYHRLVVRVRAANASGSTTASSAPSGVVADAQGRTSPPEPEPRPGPGDVVVTPAIPGGSYSSTININNPPALGFSIAGLLNPLAAVAGHVANGTNAAETIRLSIQFQIGSRGRFRRATVVRSTRNRRWTITGTLTNAFGNPVGGALLIPAWQTASQPWTAQVGIRTRSDGSFSYQLPPGPSRNVKLVYFAFSDSHGYSESNVISVKVATPVRLGARPRALRNGQTVRFSGTIGTDSIPRVGVLITLEARAPGTGWTKFNVIRSTQGRFTARYRFRRTSRRTRYQFRAVVAKQTGYPYEGGTSKTTNVTVTP